MPYIKRLLKRFPDLLRAFQTARDGDMTAPKEVQAQWLQRTAEDFCEEA